MNKLVHTKNSPFCVSSLLFLGSGTFFHSLSLTGERKSTEYWLTAEVKSAQENCV